MKYICIVLYSCIISYTILLLFLSFYKFVKITMNSFLIHKLKVEFLFYFIWLLDLLILQHFFEWSDSASVLVLGSSCYQFIPISSGARRASAVTKSQGCCLYSLFFRQTERCYQKPLVFSVWSVYLCFTSFLPQDVYKVLIDSLLGNCSPSVPTGAFCGTFNISTQAYRDHFSGRVDLSGGRRGLVSVPQLNLSCYNPWHQGRKYQILGREGKESRPSVCYGNVGVISADSNIPVSTDASSESHRSPAAACQRPKQPFMLLPLVMGRWDRNNAQLITWCLCEGPV